MEIKTAESLAFAKLSPREREIAEALHRGVSRKDVAASLGLTRGMVQNYIANVYRRLDVKSVEQMVLIVERAKAVAK